jgi:hypothetical protein
VVVNTDPEATLFNIVDPAYNGSVSIPITNLTQKDGLALIVALQEGYRVSFVSSFVSLCKHECGVPSFDRAFVRLLRRPSATLRRPSATLSYQNH